jgi:hypothetical protein
MAKWDTAVPIIVAIIGIIGTAIIVPTFSSVLPSQFLNKPILNIDIKPASYYNTIIKVTNGGTTPATNLSLILTPIEANKTVDFVTNKFSTVNVTVLPRLSLLAIDRPVPINQSFLELHVKKFVNGYGSLIILAINGTAHTAFAAYATYDQGSTRTIEGYSVSLEDLLNENYAYFIMGIIGYYIVVAYIWYLLRKRQKRMFLSKTQEQMMEVRKKLKENPLYHETFPFTLKQHIPFYKRNYYFKAYRWQVKNLMWQKKSSYKHKVVHEVKDYLCIDDFYSEVGERDEYIRINQPTDDIVLAKYNKKCLELAEATLNTIDWTKYRIYSRVCPAYNRCCI